ncbi:hypothetical protein F4779DRAFT_561629 [Xylariaceae sp. FL0662B]|nr:hypothetical protein F4779DRAFT_561629 [Xylariaceae sp. FL0662B]
MLIPNPPEGGPEGGPPADSWEEVYRSLLSFSRQNGFGIIKASGSNRVDGIPTRFEICCDRGFRTRPSSAKIRKSSSQKLDCP